MNILAKTLAWFQIAKKNPTNNDFHTQLGAHFEEVREMIEELKSSDPQGEVYLAHAKLALKNLSDYCYQNNDVISIDDKVNYLDALCDQIVTATGCAHMIQANILGAMEEVNNSNHSKFVDGAAITNEHGKIIKGPNYVKAQLYPFI